MIKQNVIFNLCLSAMAKSSQHLIETCPHPTFIFIFHNSFVHRNTEENICSYFGFIASLNKQNNNDKKILNFSFSE